jgi:hypothetical protein
MNTPFIKKPERIETLDERIKNAKRRADQALTVAIIALLLTGGAYALSLAYGITWGNLIQNNAIAAKNANQLLRSELYDALMNVSSNYVVTNIRNGTFEWSWYPLFTVAQTSNYSLNHVQIGPLGFDTITLNPPQTPLPITAGGYAFKLGNFTPRVDQIILFTQGIGNHVQLNTNLLRLTDKNARKMSISDGCLQNTNYGQILLSAPSPSCYVSGIPLTDANPISGINSLGISIGDTYLAPTYPDNFFLDGYIVFISPYPGSITFTITSPWELVLPAS